MEKLKNIKTNIYNSNKANKISIVKYLKKKTIIMN